jgi:hypothetical protein
MMVLELSSAEGLVFLLRLQSRELKGAHCGFSKNDLRTKTERDRIDQAIADLQKVGSGKRTGIGRGVRAEKKRRHRLTAEGRKRLSEMMKKRWADRRKQMALLRKPNKKAA